MGSVRLTTTLLNGVPDFAWEALITYPLPVADSSPNYCHINLYPIIREMERSGDEIKRLAAKEWRYFAINNRGVLRIPRTFCVEL